jgi:hypothetical protein
MGTKKPTKPPSGTPKPEPPPPPPPMMPPWRMLDCASCGQMFQYTRTEPRPKPKAGEGLCAYCEGYEKGQFDSEEYISLLEREKANLVRLLQEARRVLPPPCLKWDGCLRCRMEKAAPYGDKRGRR